MATAGYNLRSPGVKRLMKEAKELKEPTTQYVAYPLEDNLFEWHFTIRGAKDTPYENGYYHGRIVLPTEYPMKPPNIILLTPNGRFELNKKICLSMSAYHPEYWQPSWSIRTALLAIIGFMPTEGGGAIGSLDYPEKEKRRLAKLSVDWKCPSCGLSHRSALLEAPQREDEEALSAEAKDIASQMSFKSDSEVKEALKKLDKKTEEEKETVQDTKQEEEAKDQSSLRHRQPLARQGNPSPQRVIPPESGDVTHPSNQPHPQPKGTASLVVMWALMLMIFVLLARRAYKYFPDATPSSN